MLLCVQAQLLNHFGGYNIFIGPLIYNQSTNLFIHSTMGVEVMFKSLFFFLVLCVNGPSQK